MYQFILPFCFFVVEGLSFHSLSTLQNCPSIPIKENVLIEQVAGSWRLGYLFYDDQDEIEEDGTCIVAEFTPTSSSLINIAIHMEVRTDEFIVDRSSFDISATFHNPGEWLLHSNLSHKSYIHVKVVSLTTHHLILTFCISEETKTEVYTDVRDKDYNYILQKLREDESLKYFIKNLTKSGEVSDTNNELNELFGLKSNFRKKRSLLERITEGMKPNILKSLVTDEDNKSKHFWTIIFVKDNNVSAFNFIENASVLMKLGFDIRKGNLIEFGKCGEY